MITPLGLLLVLGATACYSLVDLVRKMAAERMPLVPLMFWMAIGAVPIFLAWWWQGGAPAPGSGYWAPGVGSGLLNIGANLALLRAVQLGELSAVVPLLGLTPVLTTLCSIVLLGEVPTAAQWFGTLLVVGGAMLLQSGAHASVEERGRHREAVLCMLAVVVAWSAAMPLDKLASAAGSEALHGAVLHAFTALAPLVFLAWRGDLRRLASARNHLGLVVVLTIGGFAALAFQLSALEHVFAGLVETIKRGIASPTSLVLGAFFFGERIGARKVVAVAVMVGGIALVLL
ncbi:MAG: DMT family transporter [Acidobacteria bacterium]|nr:MAG: DMT family transporter [Acidobacteriota bacterium]REK01017.1 MAG: DMT family transporter [Acidobacteriota bacterium]